MVCNDFANQGVLGKPNEYFVSYTQNRDADSPPVNVDEVMAHGADQTGNESIKVMANYIGAINASVAPAPPASPDKPFNNFYSTFKDAEWVHIYRIEKDRQALSRLKAAKSGIYHLQIGASDIKVGAAVSDKKKLADAAHVEYSDELREALTAEIKKIEAEEKVWENFFREHNITPFKIIYEQAAKGGRNYLAPLGEKLGYKLDPNLTPRAVKKMSDSSSEELIMKYRDDMTKQR